MPNATIPKRLTLWLETAHDAQAWATEIAETQGRMRLGAAIPAILEDDMFEIVASAERGCLKLSFGFHHKGLPVVCSQEVFTFFAQMQANTDIEAWIKKAIMCIEQWVNWINHSGLLQSEPPALSLNLHPLANLRGEVIFGAIPAQKQLPKGFEWGVVSWEALTSILTSHPQRRSVKVKWHYLGEMSGTPGIFHCRASRELLNKDQRRYLSWPSGLFDGVNNLLRENKVGLPPEWSFYGYCPAKEPVDTEAIERLAGTSVRTGIVNAGRGDSVEVVIEGESRFVYQGAKPDFFGTVWSPAWGEVFWNLLEQMMATNLKGEAQGPLG